MTDMETMAEDLRKARLIVKTIHGNHYREVVAPYIEIIKQRIQQTGETTLLATFECTRLIVGYLPKLECLAAGIEIVAPSEVAV